MEEEPTPGVVTRLRRRLSTDKEESISPATPTKKKSGRLAAKPQLENIDELATISPRRSRRSIVKEPAEMIDDKHLTPSRRSSRARSVTSNIMYQCCESPRAKRAARRNSHTGSDNEVTVTPRSRRIRNNSNTSSEYQDEVGERNINEPNKELEDIAEVDISSSKIRRSPRLNAKKNTQNTSFINTTIEDSKSPINQEKEEKEHHLSTETEVYPNAENLVRNVTLNGDTNAKENVEISKNASLSDSFLVRNMDKKPKFKHTSQKNKSMSFSEDVKTNRTRSTSFNNLTINFSDTENIFFSDNEKRRKKILRNREKMFECNDFDKKFKNSHKNKCKSQERHLYLHNKNHSASKENVSDISVNSKKGPSFTDFNSDCRNTITKKIKRNSTIDADDQCVPVVDQHFNNENIQDSNLSTSNKKIVDSTEERKADNDYEPMDIDETFNANQTKETEMCNLSDRNKSDLNLNSLDACKNSVKSPKLLTEISAKANDIEVKPLPENSIVIYESESLSCLGTTLSKKDNYNQGYTLDTDVLKQNKIQKLGISTSTAVNISSSSKMYKKDDETPKSRSKSKSETNDTSGEISDRNEFLDNEAEDAGLGYESGDSRDEDERRYEDDHEILEKGVTLTSESDGSDDSDYEKDSFVVSSDEQDYELLSGSGDDLSQSDNELMMTEKSKSKYNKRKTKETKLASREMYQARHNIKVDSSVVHMKKKSRKGVPTLKYSFSTNESESEQQQCEPKTKENQEAHTSLENSNCFSKESTKASEKLVQNNDTVMDEKELTIYNNENKSLSKDPLSLEIKEEAKSFSKDKDMSIVNFSTLENMAHVDVDEDISVSKTDATKDPLDESDNDSESSISENESLKRSYENMLNNLNEVHHMQENKTKNTSLNLKTKRNTEKEEHIVDNLSVTSIIEDKTEIRDDTNDTVTPKKLGKKKTSTVTESPTVNHSDVPEIITKKKKHSIDIVENIAIEDNVNVLTSNKTSDVTAKGNTSINSEELPKDNYIGTTETSTKKKKKKHLADDVENIVIEMDAAKLLASDKFSDVTAEEKISVSLEANCTDTTKNSVKKKKKKHSSDNIENEVAEVNDLDVLASNRPDVAKKVNISNSTKDTESSNDYVDITEKCPKKKKIKHSQNNVGSTVSEVNATDVSISNRASDLREKESTSKSVKETESAKDNVAHIEIIRKNKKKKKKQLQNANNEDTQIEPMLNGKKSADSNIGAAIFPSDHNGQASDEELKIKYKKKGYNANVLRRSTIQHSTSNEGLISTVHGFHMSKKRKHSANSETLKDEIGSDDATPACNEMNLGNNNKKRKFSNGSTSKKADEEHNKGADCLEEANKKSKKLKRMDDQKDADHKEHVIFKTLFKKSKQITQITENAENPEHAKNRMKKRKIEDEDELAHGTSVKKSENIFNHITVPRLPATVIEQLEGKPVFKKPKITGRSLAISTSSFHVEKTRSHKSKPSQYLEQSVRIDFPSPEPKKKKPKLTNVAPAPSSSTCGFTTTFKVNVVPKETQFVAPPLNMSNFKYEHLYKKNIRRQGTQELYKKQRKIKLSKF